MSGLRLSFYADDFTGATDALESLTAGGMRTLLFLAPPEPGDVDADAEAVGVAGRTRALGGEELRAELRRAFAALGELGAPLCHYKVCSTFDSSPAVGSIGAAIELGLDALGGDWVPLLVGAPALGRWTVFGHHFARAGADGRVLRLDRHPIADHPITPMRESELLRHLAQQTSLESGLVMTRLAGEPSVAEQVRGLREAGGRVVLFDVADEEDLVGAGEAIDAGARAGEVRLVVGSSGVGSALTARWRQAGGLAPSPLPAAEPAGRIAAFSGSCSAVSGRQIEWARANGWTEVPLDTPALVGEERKQALGEARERMDRALERGEPVVVHSACGSGDARVAAASAGSARSGAAPGASAGSAPPEAAPAASQAAGGPVSLETAIGAALGQLARAALERGSLDRVVGIGGDTCGALARAVGIRAVRAVARTTPGAPLCVADAPGSPADGVEFVFKGGGLGEPGYLGGLRSGSSTTVASR